MSAAALLAGTIKSAIAAEPAPADALESKL